MDIASLPQNRSIGLKLILVCALVILMAVPAMFISFISYERSSRADEVTQEVSNRYGGAQYVSGPFLAVPYYVDNSSDMIQETGEYLIFPDDGLARFSEVEISLKTRSLFKVPVYQAKGTLSARFAAIDPGELPARYTFLWDEARILVGISDGRGLAEEVFLKVGNQTKKFEPDQAAAPGDRPAADRLYSKNVVHNHGLSHRSSMTFLSVPAAELMQPGRAVDMTANLVLGGAAELGIYPFAKSTRVEMNSSWASPGFKGGFAPLEQAIGDDGFSAAWSVPYLARGVSGSGPAHQINLFNPQTKAMTVQFVPDVSPYRTVNRALKYSVMFIGLVFITFFLFEVIVGVRVHPAQYILIGLAQSIFYLLLLAFSEQVGFAAAFFVAAIATIGVTAGYAGAVLRDRKYIYRTGAVFALTYGLLFVLMRLQDFALMIGALASFTAIALTMYLTRNLNWYGDDPAKPAQSSA